MEIILGPEGVPSPINSLQFGVGVGISSPTGGGGRETSTPNFSEIVVTRATDPLSVELLDHIATGTAYESAEIHLSSGAFVAAWCLSDVLLSGYSVSSGGGVPSESLSLNYVGITQTVGTAFVTYDIAKGATSSESLCS
jgi:type VI secretion system secreted protein Hcp